MVLDREETWDAALSHRKEQALLNWEAGGGFMGEVMYEQAFNG